MLSWSLRPDAEGQLCLFPYILQSVRMTLVRISAPQGLRGSPNPPCAGPAKMGCVRQRLSDAKTSEGPQAMRTKLTATAPGWKGSACCRSNLCALNGDTCGRQTGCPQCPTVCAVMFTAVFWTLTLMSHQLKHETGMCVMHTHAQTHTSLGCNPSSNDLIADVRCVTSAGKKMQLTFPTCEVQVFKINRELCWFLLPGLYGLSHTLAHRHTHARALAQGRSNCVSNTDPGPLPVSGSKTRLPCSLVTCTGTALHSLWNTAPPTACGRHLCGPSVDSLPVHRG